MSDHERKQLEEFLAAIQPNLPGYRHATFSYLALKKNNGSHLAQGRLVLQGVPMPGESKHFESASLKAGFLRLDELKLSPKQLIENLLSGMLRTPQGELLFPPEKDRSHSLHFNPFHAEGVPYQNRHTFQYRQMQLHIRGNRRERIDSLALDWELKAMPIPFESVQELCAEFGIGSMDGDSSTVEIVAFSVAAISGESSVTGTRAKLVINLVGGLEREKASIGYRLMDRNAVVKRGIISGDGIAWENATNVQRGQAELEVTAGAVLHCIASHIITGWQTPPRPKIHFVPSIRHSIKIWTSCRSLLPKLRPREQTRVIWKSRLHGCSGCSALTQRTLVGRRKPRMHLT
jgi:hypothetical protein